MPVFEGQPSAPFSGGKMAGWTGLEPAASAVTGRRYNQLNYHPAKNGRSEESKQKLVLAETRPPFIIISLRQFNKYLIGRETIFCLSAGQKLSRAKTDTVQIEIKLRTNSIQ